MSHSILSPSSSHRWLHCTPSARLEEPYPDTSGLAAKEGTAAHALCEYKLKAALGMKSDRPESDFQDEAMERHSDEYVSWILETIKDEIKPVIMIEQKLDLSDYVPEGFGTADCIIASGNKLHVVDFKYGLGVLVNAENNTQMMLYSLGALELFDSIFDIETIEMTIFQPRKENISSWTITPDELKTWAYEILKPNAELAFNGEGELCNGSWCQFCKAAAKCRKRAEAALELAKDEFKDPTSLSDEEIEQILPKLDDLIKWAEEIKEYAQQKALKGKKWNGFKLVAGRSNRKYVSEAKVIAACQKAGFTDIYKKSLRTITDMEKVMTKPIFQEILGNLVTKPVGKPTLVPVSDKRKEIEFTEDIENESKH